MTDAAAGRVADDGPGGPAIAIDDVRKRYGGRTVLDGVTLAVEAGEVVALLGPNGAGKTTTVEIVEGYRQADGGSVRVLGLDPARAGARLRARVGLMLQEGGIDRRVTPREITGLYARLFAEPADPAAVINLVGLDTVARTRYRRLSGGERQRLALALALVGRPEVLILDEPTAGLDPEARAATRALVRGLARDGIAVLLTTHDLGDVEAIADRVAVLVGGRIAMAGTVAELARGDGRVRVRTARPLTADECSSLAREVGAPTMTVDGAWTIDAPTGVDATRTIARVAAWAEHDGVPLLEVRVGHGSLESRYLELVAGASARTRDDAA